MAIGPADVHVWTLCLDDCQHPDLDQSVLSEDERARVTALVRERVIAVESSAFERLGVARDW